MGVKDAMILNDEYAAVKIPNGNLKIFPWFLDEEDNSICERLHGGRVVIDAVGQAGLLEALGVAEWNDDNAE